MIAAKNGTAIDVITNNIRLDGSNKNIKKGNLVKDYTLATGATSLKYLMMITIMRQEQGQLLL